MMVVRVNVARWMAVVCLACAGTLIVFPRVADAQSNRSVSTNPYINRIVFIGAENISPKTLKRQMRTREPSFFAIFSKPRLNTETLKRDIAHLEGFYHSSGYFEATVVLNRFEYSDDGRFVDIFIEIREGSPTRVRNVSFSDNTLFDHSDLRKGLLLEPGEPFNRSFLDTDIYTIRTKYFEKGYLGVAIVDSVRIENHTVDVHYDIEPGTQIRIRRIFISGNALAKQSVIEKELAFEAGEICRLSHLTETQRNLFETGLFTEVNIRPDNLDPIERTVDIIVRVRERKPRYIEAGFGVGNILGSRLLGEWGTRNLFGTGRTLRFRSEYAFDIFKNDQIDLGQLQFKNKFYRYDAEFHQRHVFGTKLLMSLNTFYEKDATIDQVQVKTLGASVTSVRRLSPHTDLLVGLTTENIDRDEFDKPDVESTSNIAQASISYDRRDFILNPRRGVYRFFRVEGAGGPLGGDNDFYTLSGSYQRYTELRSGFVVATRFRFGFADAFGESRDDGVPIENRFFAGGGNSVRGYAENSLGPRAVLAGEESESAAGGRVLALTNVELRHPVPLLSRIKISGAVFVDGGNVWPSLRAVKVRDFRPYASRGDVTLGDYRYSVGFGLRYNTPVGPIRLDYAVPVKLDERTDDNGRFHISLGQIF